MGGRPVLSVGRAETGQEPFADFAYPNEIGPGVRDIHSPSVPTEDEIVDLLEKALAVIPTERLWVTPTAG